MTPNSAILFLLLHQIPVSEIKLRLGMEAVLFHVLSTFFNWNINAKILGDICKG